MYPVKDRVGRDSIVVSCLCPLSWYIPVGTAGEAPGPNRNKIAAFSNGSNSGSGNKKVNAFASPRTFLPSPWPPLPLLQYSWAQTTSATAQHKCPELAYLHTYGLGDTVS